MVLLNFALVGCGRIAKRYIDLFKQKQIQGGQLIAVCDVLLERAQQYATELNIPAYHDFYDMIQQEKIDVICILTPSGLHAEHVIALAPYCKNIIVEKPMSLTLDDADKMIHICALHQTRLFVVKQNRFNLPVQKLRTAIEAKRFGKLVLGTIRVRWCRTQAYYDQDNWRGTWAYDGGVLANQASHHIDLLEWMMGDVESVFAKSSTALVNIETEDTAVVTLKFKNGALGVIEATTATRPKDIEGSLSILGEKGIVEIGGFAVNKLIQWQFQKMQPDEEKTLADYSVNPPNIYGFGHQAYLTHVIDCIQNQTPPLVDGLEGRRSLELISAIYESIETGQEVFLRFTPKKCRLGQR